MAKSMFHTNVDLSLLTPSEMARADALTIAGGKSEIELMGNAGAEVGRFIVSNYRRSPVTILCGPGNNGGDGFVIGCYLRDRGWPVRLALFGDRNKYAEAATFYLERWGAAEAYASDMIEDASLLVDALFGVGLDRPVSGSFVDIIRLANQMNLPIVSVDMPTGISGETGQVMGEAICADHSVTFFQKKPGHLLMPGREFCGEVSLCQIGVSSDVLDQIKPSTAQNSPSNWTLPVQSSSGHKYNKGHCVVVSGPVGSTGAARMSAMAALRVGAGLVTINADKPAIREHGAHLDAIMLREGSLGALLTDKRYNSIVIGPGNGITEQTYHNVLTALGADRALLLDADALTIFESDPNTLFQAIKSSKSRVVLTPHGGEFAKLFPDLCVGEDKVKAVKAASERAGAVVLLKGADSVVASPEGRAVINANAPPWLATAGSGDVLAGVIGGLQAQGMEAFDAACAGVYVHGLAGSKFGGEGMIATDLPHFLPSALAEAR